MTDDKITNDGQEDPGPVEDDKVSDKLLRGLDSDTCRTEKEVNNLGSNVQGSSETSSSDQKGFVGRMHPAKESICNIESLKSEVDSKITDRDYAEFVISTIKRTVRQEDSLVRQILYTGISKDSANPINLAVIAPTSEGKTYAVLESLQYFPKEDTWKIGSMTPKVIIRQNGILVDSNNQSLVCIVVSFSLSAIPLLTVPILISLIFELLSSTLLLCM